MGSDDEKYSKRLGLTSLTPELVKTAVSGVAPVFCFPKVKTVSQGVIQATMTCGQTKIDLPALDLNEIRGADIEEALWKAVGENKILVSPSVKRYLRNRFTLN